LVILERKNKMETIRRAKIPRTKYLFLTRAMAVMFDANIKRVCRNWIIMSDY